MTRTRNEYLKTFDDNQVHINFSEEINLHKNFIKIIRDYKKFVEKKGAKLYFAMPAIVDLSVSNEKTKEILISAPQKVEEQTGIQFISKTPLDYLFPKELMFDTTYHCNTKEAEYRTKLLIKDLKNVMK